MLTLTKKTGYALIAMVYLADRPGQYCSARQISQEYSLPLPVLMNILKTMNRQGLLVSTRGSKGGYRMACEPGEVSLARLIGAVEGPIRFVHCADKSDEESCIDGCPIRGAALKLHHELNRFLETTTLADVVGGADRSAGPVCEDESVGVGP